MTHETTRRHFLALLGASLAPLAVGLSPARGLGPDGGGPRESPGLAGASGLSVHPTPRPGIDGSEVLAADAVAPHVAELFDQVRVMAPVVDGIGCHCGCGDVEGMYSLLSCYEGVGMAQYCEICEGEGRLAVRLQAEGRTLDEIRAAIDERYG